MLYIMHVADEDEMQPGQTCDMCGQFLGGLSFTPGLAVIPWKPCKGERCEMAFSNLDESEWIHNCCAISVVKTQTGLVFRICDYICKQMILKKCLQFTKNPVRTNAVSQITAYILTHAILNAITLTSMATCFSFYYAKPVPKNSTMSKCQCE